MGLQQLGPLRAEVTYGEGGKFTAPLLLVHGLWSTALVWRPFAGYLSHRGWTCNAVELRRSGEESGGEVEAGVAVLRAAIQALEAPPVIVGHDLGATLAPFCADLSRALVLVAPLSLPPVAASAPRALHEAGGRLARFFGRPLRSPRTLEGRLRARRRGA
jgi:pimeloyl-ACP methyl ester carboxylesterase